MKNFVALIVIFAYPATFYLISNFVMSIIAATLEISKIHSTEFPLIIVHGFLVVFLSFGIFCLFITGLYLWVLSIQQIGIFLLEKVFRKEVEK
jgi:hypothetical protein